MPSMLELQYLRAILLFNNPVAAGIAFARGAQGYGRPIFFVMGSFLMVSYSMSCLMLIYTKVQLRRARKQGYFYLLPVVDESSCLHAGMPEQPQMGKLLFILVLASDFVFGVTFTTLAILGFVCPGFVYYGGGAEAVASIGAVTAAVVHLFYFVMNTHFSALMKYKLKISIVPRGQERSGHENMARSVISGKEQRISEETALRQPESAPELETEPETLSPRPYRGSPSNKPSHTSQLHSNGPIKLLEPTEGDSLIADCD